MKRKLISILLLFLIAAIRLHAQTIQVNGKKLETVNKTVLNEKTEYYQFKQSGVKNSSVENYIKSDGKYHKTSFIGEELKEFISKGTISSLGAITEKSISKKKMVYIDKSSVFVVFFFEKNTLNIMEIDKDEKDFFFDSEQVAARDDKPGTSGDNLSKCYGRCEVAFPGDSYQEFYNFLKCKIGCRKKFRQTNAQSIQEYSVSAEQPIKL